MISKLKIEHYLAEIFTMLIRVFPNVTSKQNYYALREALFDFHMRLEDSTDMAIKVMVQLL
jgi:hypothetical protein